MNWWSSISQLFSYDPNRPLIFTDGAFLILFTAFVAVYVMLCSLGEKNSHFDVWRYARAKQFVLSHYNSTAEPKRDFLVKIGLPGAWFDECLATQAAMCGDAFAFI